MVCNALVVGGRRSGAGQQTMRPGWGKLFEQLPSFRTHSLLPCTGPPITTIKTSHTICGNNKTIASSSPWWAYKCPKHDEQIISAINHSVAYSWFSSLRIYNEARTNIHQILIYGFFLFSRIPQAAVRKLEIVEIIWQVPTVSPYYCRFARKMVQILSVTSEFCVCCSSLYITWLRNRGVYLIIFSKFLCTVDTLLSKKGLELLVAPSNFRRN